VHRASPQILGARLIVAAAAVLTVGCASGGTQPAPGTGPPQPAAGTTTAQAPAWIAKMDSGRVRFSPADVEFMQGMIHHHAQAILMAGWAPSHNANPAIRELCARIVVAQRDEIVFMQRWLSEHGQQVPDADPAHFMMTGMTMTLMPGMLTPEQLKMLNDSKGKEFERRFLESMITHHQGAIVMVQRLFQSQGATQDDYVFKFASDVDADQSAEIERMTRMLNSGSLAVPRGQQ
jgi:uncharacterized protein (DUF305 family)